MAKLPGTFKKDGTVTAGNASGINDMMPAWCWPRARAEKNGKKILATVVAHAQYLDPAIMGMGPYYATKMLEKTGMKIEDMDVIEANEASRPVPWPTSCPASSWRRSTSWWGYRSWSPHRGVRRTYRDYPAVPDVAGGERSETATMCIGGGQGTAIILRREK